MAAAPPQAFASLFADFRRGLSEATGDALKLADRHRATFNRPLR